MTRQEIDAALELLESRIPHLIATEEADCVMEAFAGEAELIVERAGADSVYVRCRLNEMLAEAGLIPNELD